MNETIGHVAGTGSRGIGLLATNNVLVLMITESKFAILLLAMLIVADFRFGWGESNKRYHEAKRQGDKRRMDLYKWRTSMAVRKSANKLADYIIIMALGFSIGMACLEPLGISHMFGVFGASIVMAGCEVSSIFGHFFYLRGVTVDKKSISGFCKAFAVAVARKKDSDIGDALEETFNHQNN